MCNSYPVTRGSLGDGESVKNGGGDLAHEEHHDAANGAVAVQQAAGPEGEGGRDGQDGWAGEQKQQAARRQESSC